MLSLSYEMSPLSLNTVYQFHFLICSILKTDLKWKTDKYIKATLWGSVTIFVHYKLSLIYTNPFKHELLSQNISIECFFLWYYNYTLKNKARRIMPWDSWCPQTSTAD